MDPLKSILSQIYPLHRTLVSEGTDQALQIVGEHLPDEVNYQVETYPPGEPVWTWQVPERYVVHEAYLEAETGERFADFELNPLHLVSYSLPVDHWMNWEELSPHLYFNAKFPDSIPWQFKFYERDWGFCISKNIYDQMPRECRYRAVIRAEFVTDPNKGFRVGAGVLHPEGGVSPGTGEFLVCAHICHPMQANDDAAGVATAIGIAHRLASRPLPPGSLSVRFLFCPETIGSIAYLANNENLIPGFKAGLFAEMTGNRGEIAYHHTRQHDDLLDRIALYVLKNRAGSFVERNFADFPPNDERVINGPGVNVPCISINRWPYEEYHTSADNPDIIHEEMLQDAADVCTEIIRIYASNYIPRRTFRGPVFLSGHGLWVDWRDNWDLNRAIEKIMMRFEGQHSVFDIAEELGLDYWETRDYVEKFRQKNLVVKHRIPGGGSEN